VNRLTTPPLDDTAELRQEVIRTCLRMSELGYFLGTWGNVGVRVGGGMLVTPARTEYEGMQVDDLVLVSWEGKRVAGKRLPSSEMHVHRLLLAGRGDLGAVIHSHPPCCSAVAAARQSIPCIVEDMAQVIGGEVRCSRYVPAGHHLELAEAAREAMGDEVAAALLANHGVVVGGRSLKEAIVATQVLEKAAQLYIHAASLGGAVPIPQPQVEEERHRFLFKYGTPADGAAES
jgi:L-ribulose-5-phosphate 4-epimerase